MKLLQILIKWEKELLESRTLGQYEEFGRRGHARELKDKNERVSQNTSWQTKAMREANLKA